MIQRLIRYIELAIAAFVLWGLFSLVIVLVQWTSNEFGMVYLPTLVILRDLIPFSILVAIGVRLVYEAVFGRK